MGVLFGQRLLELRKAARLTQAALAAQIATSEAFISSLETGRKRPSIDTVTALARVLPCTSTELLERLAQDAEADRDRRQRDPHDIGLLLTPPHTSPQLAALVQALTTNPVLLTAALNLQKVLARGRRTEGLLALLEDLAREAD